MKNTNPIIIILIVLLLTSIASAKTSYTSNSETTCDLTGVCTQSLYSGTQFVEENGTWVSVNDAKSLKDKGFEIKYLETEVGLDINVIDFNSSSLTLEYLIDSTKSKIIPIKVWEPNQTIVNKTGDYKLDYTKTDDKSIDFTKVGIPKIDKGLTKTSYQETIPFTLSSILEFGTNSTTIKIQDAGTGNLGDTYVDRVNPAINFGTSDLLKIESRSSTEIMDAYLRFNISSLPANVIVENSTLFLYNLAYGSSYNSVIARHQFNDSFGENTTTWNNRPCPGAGCNSTNGSVQSVSNTNRWRQWNITNMVKNSTANAKSNVSIWMSAEMQTEMFYLQFVSKDNVTAPTLRPYINITYTVTLPDTPVLNSSSTGNFYINQSWINGSGAQTDSYNSTNGTAWINNTLTYRNTTLSPHKWSNLTIYAYNNTYGFLSTNPLNISTQIPNNPISISNISNGYNVSIGTLLSIKPIATDADNDTPIFSNITTKGTFYPANGTLLWTPGVGDSGIYNWMINVTDNNGSTSSKSFSVSVNNSAPGTPTDVAATTGNFYVNTTWNSSINTNTFNVSTNGIWSNGTANTSKNSTLPPHAYQNLTIFAYNLSSNQLSTPAYINTQIPNNVPTIGNLSQSDISIYASSGLNTIQITNVNDADNDSLNVTVGISFLGFETNYTMTNAANTSTWYYVFSTGVTGFYTISHIYAQDNQSAMLITNYSTQFEVATAPVTIVVPPGGGGGGTSERSYVTILNNGSLDDIKLQIQSISSDIPTELSELIAQCYTGNLLVKGQCAKTFVFTDIMNWYPVVVASFVAAFFTILAKALIYRRQKQLLVDTLLYGTISLIVIQGSIIVGFNAYLLNYLFQTNLPGAMFISVFMWSVIITWFADNFFVRNSKRL